MEPNNNPRTMCVRLSQEALGDLIGIPPGARVVGVEARMDPWMVTVLVESPDFHPLCAPDVESPLVHRKPVSIESLNVPRDWYEWDWAGTTEYLRAEAERIWNEGGQ